MKQNVDFFYQKFILDNRLIVWSIVDREVESAKTDIYATVDSNGVRYENALVAYRWDEPYSVVSAWISSRINRRVLEAVFYKTAMKVRYLNGDVSVDLAYGYLDALCKDFIDGDSLVYSRDRLYGIVEQAYSDELELDRIVELRRWEWLGRFALLPSRYKASIRMTHTNQTTTENTIRAIEQAISDLGAEKSFINIKTLSEKVGMHRNSISRYFEIFKDEIDSINMSNFDTTNFHTYVKDENVYEIIQAIRDLSATHKRLSKVGVSEATDLSRMTIHRLWEDKRIQEVMEDYNNAMKV